jgi:Flp pilus assembly protein TadD
MEDGTPPPDSAVIETVCNGVARPEGYTDTKGGFSIRLGQKTHMAADATLSSEETRCGDFGSSLPVGFGSLSGTTSERHLIECELRASLPGYRSDLVMLSGRRRGDNPDVGTIVLRRRGDVEGATISASSLQAPKAARKAYDKGRKALRKSKWAEGRRQFEKAVQIHPKYAAAWFELGIALEQQGKLDEARKAHGQAIASDAKFVKPYLQLAAIAATERNWKEVAENTERVMKLDPFHFPVAYFYNSAANYNLRNLDAAEKSAREALKLDKQHQFPKIHNLLGVILAEKGDWPGAAQHMRSYLQLVPDAPDRQVVQKRLSELEKLLSSTAYSRPQQ